DVAAGLQPEQGAAVIEQVELDVAAAAHQLLLALRLRPARCPIAADELRVDAQEGSAHVLREGKIRVPIAAIVPIVKNAADAARLVAVLQKKIFIAPALVFLIRRDRRMRVAGGLHGGMEVAGVGIALLPASREQGRE